MTWSGAAGVVVAAAVVARVHNALAYPPLHDFDGPGHAINVFALFQGRLPSLASWSGFHPPLYYALGGALWHALPAAVPVHAALRLLSAAAGFGALAISWRALRRLVPAADAAVVAAFVAGVPVFALATSMLGNETTCALLATAALAQLCAAPAPGARGAGRAAVVTGALAGLSALAKSTGFAVLAVTLLTWAWRGRHRPAAGARALALSALPALLLTAPWYGPLVAESGSLLAALSGGAVSPDARAEMAAQPPGERHLSDYLSVPPATLLAPFRDAAGMVRSVPGLLYASTFADGHGVFLPPERPRVVGVAALLAIAGLLPTMLGLLGVGVAWRRRRALAQTAPALLFAGVLGAGFLLQTWLLPVYSAVKASYLLPALLPGTLLLALGLTRLGGRGRTAARAALLACAAFGSAATWWGWWREPIAVASRRPPAAATRGDEPRALVASYFRALGRDPLRTLPLLSDAFHRQHGLRLATSAEIERHLLGVAPVPSHAGETAPVERHQVAWLAAQKREAFRTLGDGLAVLVLGEQREGDRATVSVQVTPASGRRFEQRFELGRDGPDDPWRIDAITQHGVGVANGPAAFVAHPTEATRAWLERALEGAVD